MWRSAIRQYGWEGAHHHAGEIGDLGGLQSRATDQWLPVPSAKGVQVGGGSFHHTVRVS
jgi:hypothetical protein